MKKTDKLLIGIVTGIVLLVVAAFGVALGKPKQAYQAEDKPEGVGFNYLFALQQKDYARAYGYLSPTLRHYPPDAESFTNDVRNNYVTGGLEDSSTTLEIVSVDIVGNQAFVEFRRTDFYAGDLFNSYQSSYNFTMTLERDGSGGWKIVHSDNYWLWCWDNVSPCN